MVPNASWFWWERQNIQPLKTPVPSACVVDKFSSCPWMVNNIGCRISPDAGYVIRSWLQMACYMLYIQIYDGIVYGIRYTVYGIRIPDTLYTVYHRIWYMRYAVYGDMWYVYMVCIWYVYGRYTVCGKYGTITIAYGLTCHFGVCRFKAYIRPTPR